MNDHAITLTVPDYLYDQVRKAAETLSEPVESLLLRRIEEAFGGAYMRLSTDERAELNALGFLSDDALWTIVREQMPADRQARLQQLMMRNSAGTISSEEHEELARLVDQGQRLTLRKARAADLLMNRGYTVSARDMSLTHE